MGAHLLSFSGKAREIIQRFERPARLTTALILFGFVTSHLLNHALGIRSIGAMQAASAILLIPWQTPIGLIVLYSNGMTHPAQARDELARRGYENVYILTDGLVGFVDRCLKPVSLRSGPLSEDAVEKVNTWRNYFTGPPVSE